MVCLSCSSPHVHIPILRVNEGVAYGYDYTVGNHCNRLVDMEKSLQSMQQTALQEIDAIAL
jgi:hypothetical protein